MSQAKRNSFQSGGEEMNKQKRDVVDELYSWLRNVLDLKKDHHLKNLPVEFDHSPRT